MKFKTRDMVLISLFTALTAVGAFIQIPTPLVSFSLQFLFCAYSGIFLGSKYGLYSQLLYVGIGLAGVPVFTKGGGVSYVLQPSFGYILGLILCAYIIGRIVEKMESISFTKLFLISVLGLMMLYIIGVPYLYLMFNRVAENPMSFATAVKVGFLQYIVVDLAKCAVVAFTAVKIIPILRKSGYVNLADVK